MTPERLDPTFSTDQGRAAYVSAVEAMRSPDRLAFDAAARFARAVDVVALATAEWERNGRPLVHRNSNGTMGTHPLLKVIQGWEADAMRYAAALRPRPRLGRPAINDLMVPRLHAVPDRRPGEPPRITATGKAGKAS